jgi:hypothetical protein
MAPKDVSVRPTDPEASWVNPDDLPPNISPLERAIIAARNIRLWTDWMLKEVGPAPEKGSELIDVGAEGKDGS